MEHISHKRYIFPELDFLRYVRNTYLKNINLQTGGSVKEKIHKFKDNHKIYSLRVATIEYDGFIRILVLSKSEKECVTVLIDKTSDEAILHNMSYYKDCALEGLKRPGGGTVLLRFIYKYIISIKNKYGITKIVLQDNSFLYCNRCSTTTKLARLKMLTHGYTWYSKYGFKPYDPLKKSLDRKLLKAYEINKKTILKLKTTKLDIIKITNKVQRKEKTKYDLNKIKEMMKNYPIMGLFLRRLSNEYDKYCCLINYILEEIYNPMPPKKPLMYDMFKKDFYLKI